MDTQGKAAESHAPAPMPRRRAVDRAMQVLIAGRFEWLGRFPIARWAPIPLRLIVGYGFMAHGFAKLARGPDAFPAILQALGVPAPHLMGWLTILVEIVGGLFVLLGADAAGQHTDGGGSPGRDDCVHLPYGFSSIQLQAVTAAGAQFGPPALKPISFTSCLAAPSWVGTVMVRVFWQRREITFFIGRRAGCRSADDLMEPPPGARKGQREGPDMNAGFGSWLLGMSLGAGALGGCGRPAASSLCWRRRLWRGAALCTAASASPFSRRRSVVSTGTGNSARHHSLPRCCRSLCCRGCCRLSRHGCCCAWRSAVFGLPLGLVAFRYADRLWRAAAAMIFGFAILMAVSRLRSGQPAGKH